MFMFKKSLDIPSKAEALPGRSTPIRTMGRFWGAERKFWELPEGAYVTAFTRLRRAMAVTRNP